MPFKLGLKLATQRCAQAVLGPGWRMPGRPSSGVGRLAVTEEPWTLCPHIPCLEGLFADCGALGLVSSEVLSASRLRVISPISRPGLGCRPLQSMCSV